MTEHEKRRDLIRTHIRKAEAALRAARLLLTEGLHDDCVSRSYYAIFHAASGLLLTKGLSTSKHKGVLSLFDQHFVKPRLVRRELSGWIHEAFDFRQDADYGDFPVDAGAAAGTALENAERFLDEVLPLLTEWMDAPGPSAQEDP